MEKIITYDTLRSFAYSNDQICKKPIRGIVLEFFGLGVAAMFDEHTENGKMYAEKGILFVTPYYNPWSWMNRQAIRWTEEILDVLFEKYQLPEATPIVSSGGSMGGLSALTYTRYAKRTPVACVANCPVCDLVFHYTERPDLPRTIYSAMYDEEGSLDEAMKRFSPLHLVEQMPDVKYRIIHCDADAAVNLHSHSEKFVEAMRAAGRDITLDIEPGRGHCDLSPEKAKQYTQYCLENFE